jgi:hypothetical protein
VYPSRLAETDVLHPGRARTTPPLTHHCRPRQSPTPHHRPAPRSAGTNPAVRTPTPLWPPARPPPPAPPNQATTGTARSRPSPRCSSQGTPSTRNRPCWSRSAPDETPRVEMWPAKTTPTAPQSVHWNSAVNGPGFNRATELSDLRYEDQHRTPRQNAVASVTDAAHRSAPRRLEPSAATRTERPFLRRLLPHSGEVEHRGWCQPEARARRRVSAGSAASAACVLARVPLQLVHNTWRRSHW